MQGLNKILLNEDKINTELNKSWNVVSEAIQTILRREGYPKPFEALKDLTRKNKEIDQDTIHQFIDSLNIKDSVKDELKKITPFNYTGV